MYNAFPAPSATSSGIGRLLTAINTGVLINVKIALNDAKLALKYESTCPVIMHALCKLQVVGDDICYEIINTLLRRGANVQSVNHAHMNCLALALEIRAPPRVIGLLIERGTSVKCLSLVTLQAANVSPALIRDMLKRYQTEVILTIYDADVLCRDLLDLLVTFFLL